ncbi:MAG: hypothetical protein A2Z34_02030 [Planctomycetes bacterium RBG_16_59_8]|nr:MAG: hypothetical protein A2Z34_02030 [Planctomycetes bacterium RBG_16_59_8]
MPIYEYSCERCANKFEVLVRSADQKIACPDCGGARIEKLFSSFSATSASTSPAACPIAPQSPG